MINYASFLLEAEAAKRRLAQRFQSEELGRPNDKSAAIVTYDSCRAARTNNKQNKKMSQVNRLRVNQRKGLLVVQERDQFTNPAARRMSKSDRMRTVRRLLSGYVMAALSVGVAVVVTLKLGAVIEHTATLFFCSVMLSSWYGGLWPGFFAVFLSVVALDYYFVPPIYALGIGPVEVPDMVAFVATALFISWLNGRQKRAEESLCRARDGLDAKVRERTADLKSANDHLQSEIAEREAVEVGLIQARTEIARIARITTMGELAASIAHELNQPLGSIVMSGDVCLRWLATEPPDLEEARQAVQSIIRDGTRASSVLVRIRGLLRRGERSRERLDINDVIREVVGLLDGELRRSRVALRTEMPGNLSPVVGDRVLLQQVILNLMMNAMEAMRAVSDRMRVLRIRTEEQPLGIVVLVQDSGPGVDQRESSRIFEAFYTTKVQGIGMGLTISRSIIEAHGGRLWSVANDGPGSTFCFSLPTDQRGKA